MRKREDGVGRGGGERERSGSHEHVGKDRLAVSGRKQDIEPCAQRTDNSIAAVNPLHIHNGPSILVHGNLCTNYFI